MGVGRCSVMTGRWD